MADYRVETNRLVLRSLVDRVRDHMNEHHAGEDTDCMGEVMPALVATHPIRLVCIMEIALCALARLPDDRATLDAIEEQLAQMDTDPTDGGGS